MCIYHQMNLERKIGNIRKLTLFFLTQMNIKVLLINERSHLSIQMKV